MKAPYIIQLKSKSSHFYMIACNPAVSCENIINPYKNQYLDYQDVKAAAKGCDNVWRVKF